MEPLKVLRATRSEYSSNGGTKSAQHSSGPLHKFTGGYTGGVIPAAIQTRRNVEVRQVNLPSDPIQPAVVLVDAGVIPLTILFRSASSALTVMQEHTPGQVAEQQQTNSEDEPHRLIHSVIKPIIQEVREIITPFRRVVQEIQPVQEDIHTIVAKSQQIATNAHKYSERHNYGTSDGGFYDTSINYNNVGPNFNTANQEHIVKPFPTNNLNYKENNPGPFGKAWSSSSGFPTFKTKTLSFNNDTNNSKKSFESVSHPTDYKNYRSTHSSVKRHESQQNGDNYKKSEENNDKKTDKNIVIDAKNLTSIESTSKKPSSIKPKTSEDNFISKTNHGQNKLSGSKRPLASPVKNLRSKLLRKHKAKID